MTQGLTWPEGAQPKIPPPLYPCHRQGECAAMGKEKVRGSPGAATEAAVEMLSDWGASTRTTPMDCQSSDCRAAASVLSSPKHKAYPIVVVTIREYGFWVCSTQ